MAFVNIGCQGVALHRSTVLGVLAYAAINSIHGQTTGLCHLTVPLSDPRQIHNSIESHLPQLGNEGNSGAFLTGLL